MSHNSESWTNIHATIDQAQQRRLDLHHVLLLTHAAGRQHYYDNIYGNLGQRQALYQRITARTKLQQQRDTPPALPQPDQIILNQVYFRLVNLLRLLDLDIAVLEELSSERFDKYKRWNYFKACEDVVRSCLTHLQTEVEFWAHAWKHNQPASSQAQQFRSAMRSMEERLMQIDEPEKHEEERDHDESTEGD